MAFRCAGGTYFVGLASVAAVGVSSSASSPFFAQGWDGLSPPVGVESAPDERGFRASFGRSDGVSSPFSLRQLGPSSLSPSLFPKLRLPPPSLFPKPRRSPRSRSSRSPPPLFDPMPERQSSSLLAWVLSSLLRSRSRNPPPPPPRSPPNPPPPPPPPLGRSLENQSPSSARLRSPSPLPRPPPLRPPGVRQSSRSPVLSLRPLPFAFPKSLPSL
mmetsp:Transcript_31398/g.56912  ORF Transcript_31398/g.56912 Transcript_31398/m.56912 type:complete len:215 (-) Transcript_31398:184-828(-)